MTDVRIIGGGLAGCEASLQLARRGMRVALYEMKPLKKTPAQKLDGLAELVCSNSFRSTKAGNAVALLKEEMALLGGVLIGLAKQAEVPAGDCLAVDRVEFSRLVEEAINNNPLIQVVHEEVIKLPIDGIPTILATGPLTSDPLANDLVKLIGQERLSFYDAIAPIIEAESVDMHNAFIASRWRENEEGDYVNCPLTKEQYQEFVTRLNDSTRAQAHSFEHACYFEGCLPLEVMAERGVETLRFGPMKASGLTDPKTGRWPYAVLQLRREDKYGASYNLVGCQTRMTIPEQKEVFSIIPALKNAKFMRYGAIHRNTYVNSPDVLDEFLRVQDSQKNPTNVFLAGQISGVEGYVESMAMGLLVAYIVSHLSKTQTLFTLPEGSVLGGLYGHVRGAHRASPKDPYSPSNVTWAMVKPLLDTGRIGRKDKRLMMHERGVRVITEMIAGDNWLS